MTFDKFKQKEKVTDTSGQHKCETKEKIMSFNSLYNFTVIIIKVIFFPLIILEEKLNEYDEKKFDLLAKDIQIIYSNQPKGDKCYL